MNDPGKKKSRAGTARKSAALVAAEAELKALKEELSDLTLLYEATIEHGEAVEDQL